jgi:hypothetical protein
VQRESARHLLHLLLTLATAGLWVVVWFLASYATGPWRCSVCGAPVEVRSHWPYTSMTLLLFITSTLVTLTFVSITMVGAS